MVLKICVYAISKNEAHFVQRFCESAADADMILIADTGSDDGLPEEAVKYGATVHHICIPLWRNDVFVAPPPGPEWVLNQTTWLWETPISE